MPASVIIQGPQGCGKTRNAEALRKHYKLSRVVDTGADLSRPFYRVPVNDVLVLTDGTVTLHHSLFVKVVPFDEAMKAAGLTPYKKQ
jgi:hypothetical protein